MTSREVLKMFLKCILKVVMGQHIYIFTLMAVKKQIAMLLDIVHFKDRHGSTYFFTLIVVKRQIAILCILKIVMGQHIYQH